MSISAKVSVGEKVALCRETREARLPSKLRVYSVKYRAYNKTQNIVALTLMIDLQGMPVDHYCWPTKHNNNNKISGSNESMLLLLHSSCPSKIMSVYRLMHSF